MFFVICQDKCIILVPLTFLLYLGCACHMVRRTNEQRQLFLRIYPSAVFECHYGSEAGSSTVVGEGGWRTGEGVEHDPSLDGMPTNFEFCFFPTHPTPTPAPPHPHTVSAQNHTSHAIPAPQPSPTLLPFSFFSPHPPPHLPHLPGHTRPFPLPILGILGGGCTSAAPDYFRLIWDWGDTRPNQAGRGCGLGNSLPN